MRKLFTMFLVLGVAVLFAQSNQAVTHPVGQPVPVSNHNFIKHLQYNPHKHSSVTRGESACDSFDLMDYCTYNEVVALDDNQAASAYYGFNTASNPLLQFRALPVK